MPLSLMHLSEQRSQPPVVIDPARPVLDLPNVEFFSAFHAVIMQNTHRKVKIFTAFHAVLNVQILRME
jgi:hypothetical protein